MITLHHKEDRILWLLEELKVAYRLQLEGAKLNADGTPIDPLKQESSSGFDRIASGITSSLSGAMITKETPVLKDGNLILRETGPIVEYLIERYGKGRFAPKSAQARLDNTFFMHYAEATFMPPLVLRTVFMTVQERSPFFVKPFTTIILEKVRAAFLDSAIHSNFELVDSFLKKDGGRNFLAGERDPTGGDFMMSTPVRTVIDSGAFKEEEVPQSLRDYMSRLRARSAYKAAFDRLAEASKGL